MENLWGVVVHLGGNGKGLVVVSEDGGVHLVKAEHGCAVHCYMIASGYVRGGGEGTRDTCGDAVVETGRHQSGGGKLSGASGLGGRKRGGVVTEGVERKTPRTKHQKLGGRLI